MIKITIEFQQDSAQEEPEATGAACDPALLSQLSNIMNYGVGRAANDER